MRPILKGRVNFPVCLAPMVGLSHIGLRAMVRQYLPSGAVTLWPTEMLNSRRLPMEKLGETEETFRLPEEEGLIPQILANEPEPIFQSVQKLKAWGAEGIDINMGCPVRKALRHNYGVALMGDPGYAAEVVRMAVKASDLPVSVKMRAGLQNDDQFLVDFSLGLEAAGASWLCLHPRLAGEVRRGKADWSQIRRLREKVKLPVIGNGDVQTSEDVVRMLEETGCDMVMVGRALTVRPWILWQMGERFGLPAPLGREGQTAPQDAHEEGREFGRALLYLLSVLEQYFSSEAALKRLNFHLRNAHPWLEFGHALTAAVAKAKTLSEARDAIQKFFMSPQKMMQRTDLRY